MSFDYEYNGTNLRSSGETWEEKQIERLERRVAALTAERDDWRDRCTEARAERDAAREERDEYRRRLEMAEAERDVLNGSACATEQADGCGPCGVCKDCLKAKRDELQRRLDAVVEAVESDARIETTALVQAVRAIAEGREP